MTVDQGMEHQHNFEALRVSVVLIRCRSNTIDDMAPLADSVLRVLDRLAKDPSFAA